MGCTPSKLAAAYGEDTVCQDLDTCSTFVSSLKSSVSTPEGTRLRVDDTGGNPTSLSVPSPNTHGNQCHPSRWSTAPGAPSHPGQPGAKPRSPSPDMGGDMKAKLAEHGGTDNANDRTSRKLSPTDVKRRQLDPAE